MIERSSWFKGLLGLSVFLFAVLFVASPLRAQDLDVPSVEEHPKLSAAQVSGLDRIALSDVTLQTEALKALKLYADNNGQMPENVAALYVDLVEELQANGSLGEKPVMGAKWLIIHLTRLLQDVKEPSVGVLSAIGQFGSVSRYREGYYYQPEVTRFNHEAIRALVDSIDTLRTQVADAEEAAGDEVADTSALIAQLETKATELGQLLSATIASAFTQDQPFDAFSADSDTVKNLLKSWKTNVTEDIVLRAVYAAGDAIEQDDKFARNLLTALDSAVLQAKNALGQFRYRDVGLHTFVVMNSRLNSLMVRYPIAGVRAINANSAVNVLDIWEMGLGAISQEDAQTKALGEELISQVVLLLVDVKGSELADYINTPGMYSVFSAERVAQTYAGIDYGLLGLVEQDAANYRVFGSLPFDWSVSAEGKAAAKETLERVVKSRLYSLIPEFTAQTKAEIYALKRVQYDSPAFLNVNDLATLAAKRLWMITGLSSSEISTRLQSVFSNVENLNTVVEAAIAEASQENLEGSKSFWAIPEAGSQTSAVLDSSLADGQGFYVWPMTYNDRVYYSFHTRYAHGFSFDAAQSLDASVATQGGLPVTFLIESRNMNPNFFMTSENAYNADAVRRFISKKIEGIERIFDVVNRLAPEESLALLTDFVEQWVKVADVIESEEYLEATSAIPGRQAVTASLFTQLFAEVLAGAFNKASEAYTGDLAWVSDEENRQEALREEANRVVVFTSLILQHLNEAFSNVYISPERTSIIRNALGTLDAFTGMQENAVLTAGLVSTTTAETSDATSPQVSGLSLGSSGSGTQGEPEAHQGQGAPASVSLMNETAVASFDAKSIWNQTWRLPLIEHFGNLERIQVEVEAPARSSHLRENAPEEPARPQTREVLQATKSNQAFMDEFMNRLDMDRGFVNNPRL